MLALLPHLAKLFAVEDLLSIGLPVLSSSGPGGLIPACSFGCAWSPSTSLWTISGILSANQYSNGLVLRRSQHTIGSLSNGAEEPHESFV